MPANMSAGPHSRGATPDGANVPGATYEMLLGTGAPSFASANWPWLLDRLSGALDPASPWGGFTFTKRDAVIGTNGGSDFLCCQRL
jgi:hypothetical protein